MPNYRNTKIYIIRSNNTDRVYIGATTQPLSGRFRDHNSKFRNGRCKCKVKEILEHGGAYIELLELFPCDIVEESRARERHWMRIFDGQKVNKNIPGRTMAEYRRDHKEKRNEYDRQRRRNNPDYFKTYRQDHKEQISKYHKHHYQNNKQKVLEHAAEKFECPCGGRYTRNHIAQHLKTLKHKAYLIGEWSKHNIFNHL